MLASLSWKRLLISISMLTRVSWALAQIFCSFKRWDRVATISIISPKINWPNWQILCSSYVCLCFVWRIGGGLGRLGLPWLRHWSHNGYRLPVTQNGYQSPYHLLPGLRYIMWKTHDRFDIWFHRFVYNAQWKTYVLDALAKNDLPG